MGLFKRKNKQDDTVIGRNATPADNENGLENNHSEPDVDVSDNTILPDNGDDEVYEEMSADMPSANSDGRDGKNNKKLLMTGAVLVSMVVMFAGATMTMSNYSENQEQKKAEEAQKEADRHKQVEAENSNSISAEQDAIKANQTLPPPVDAEEDKEETSDTEEDIVAPVAEPRPPEPQPNYNQYNSDNNMVAGRDYTPPAQPVQPQAQPIGQFVDDEFEDEPAPVQAVEAPKPSGILVDDVYATKRAEVDDERAGQYKPLQLANGKASQRGDKSMLLVRGTTIPCVLITRIDSTYQGFATCQLTKDVYSANGAVLLMERGSKVFGEQNIQMSQGKARVAILWSRVETPKGVSVSLDSPATGQLGEMGIDARVNNHYWKRFSGAIMLSVIQDGFAVARSHLEKQNENGNNTTVTNTTNTAESMSEEVLKNTINIPPTATVNQGTVINIMVNRDVDFSGIYELKRR
ncbi:type IV secretion system protein VirB10 [Moraxella equi]|uniref:Type IV secretion system protein VirB10 n=1 Tax=Moraxella equi TaxID=60442 RepID=A0A378URE9_9GAMM|nr:type IV secretion system protein VirB10 [Moraxella equi]OPH37649.1 hypothetical protein B5J93_07975 [Moraxella equi]STZ82948.1 type IV secretion system protein VirB10 [Moraxella equi]